MRIETRFDAGFDYDDAPPRRLNGEWDTEKEARLDGYRAMYRAEQATAGE